MKISKIRFLQGFCIVVLLLAIARCAFPSIAEERNQVKADSLLTDKDTLTLNEQTSKDIQDTYNKNTAERIPESASMFFDGNGNQVKHKIWSVNNFSQAFPDTNDLQMSAARRWGIQPVADRQEAEERKAELVYASSCPYYDVGRLNSSIPYLVPRAAELLQDIGQSFFDSLQIKGVPLHKIIVTSITRSKADVDRLRKHNPNATENSCHMYATTFDISYNRYRAVQTQQQPRRTVRNDTLKWILSEVLRDKREQGRCYIKYERKQGCFHITVR